MIIPVHNLIWDAAQGNVPSMVLHEKLYEPHYTQGYQPTCRSTPWNGITLKCVIIVILQILHVTFHIFIKVYLRSESSQQKMKCLLLGAQPQLLNCQMQSYFSWLLFLGAEKPLVRQFGVEGDFHPFRPLLQCHNNL